MDLKAAKVGSGARLHSELLAEREARAAAIGQRWRTATRISLLALLAGSTFQLYLMHVYATIAALPTLGVPGLH